MADPKLLGSKGKKWQQAKAIIADGLSYSAKMTYKNTKTQLKSCTIKAVQFLEANQSGERSTFVDDAKWRQENASWLRRSRRVAYAIMDYMQDNGLSRNDVAEKLGVSPQYVSKILSGKVNFSFKTISEIEEGLGIELFQAAAMEA